MTAIITMTEAIAMPTHAERMRAIGQKIDYDIALGAQGWEHIIREVDASDYDDRPADADAHLAAESRWQDHYAGWYADDVDTAEPTDWQMFRARYAHG